MKFWIQKSKVKKGALHIELGIPKGKRIPPRLLIEIEHSDIGSHIAGHKVTRLLKKRANFALNVRRRK